MKRALLIAAILLMNLPAARAAGCDDAPDQATMNACATRSLKASDARLNALYREIEQRLADDEDARHRLVAAQRAWVSFRDAECGFSASAVEGGSVYPMIQAACRDDLTTARIADFRRYLSCEEGDTSCPVPPAN